MKYHYILATSLFMCFTTPTLAYKNINLDRLNKACGEQLCLNQGNPNQISLVNGGSDRPKTVPEFFGDIGDLGLATCLLGLCLEDGEPNPTTQGRGGGGRPNKEQEVSGSSNEVTKTIISYGNRLIA